MTNISCEQSSAGAIETTSTSSPTRSGEIARLSVQRAVNGNSSSLSRYPNQPVARSDASPLSCAAAARGRPPPPIRRLSPSESRASRIHRPPSLARQRHDHLNALLSDCEAPPIVNQSSTGPSRGGAPGGVRTCGLGSGGQKAGPELTPYQSFAGVATRCCQGHSRLRPQRERLLH